MKVSILHPPWLHLDTKCSGGLERTALQELYSLKQQGISSEMFVSSASEKLEQINIIGKGTTLPEKEKSYYKKFAENKATGAIAHLINTPLAIEYVNKPLILHFNNLGHLLETNNKQLRKKYEKTLFVFCSEFVKKDFKRKYPFIKEKNCRILYNGVDTNKFVPKKNKEYDKNILKFVYVGQWNRTKGLYSLIAATKKLDKQNINYEMHLIGGPDLWNYHNMKIDTDIEKLISNNKKIISHGKIDHQKLPVLLRDMDVLLCPSEWDDPSPLVCYEAQSCGLPVIGTKSGGIPEIVKNKRTGFIIEKKDSDSLATAMHHLILDPQKLKNMSKEARKRMLNKFSWKDHMKNLLKLYQEANNE